MTFQTASQNVIHDNDCLEEPHHDCKDLHWGFCHNPSLSQSIRAIQLCRTFCLETDGSHYRCNLTQWDAACTASQGAVMELFADRKTNRPPLGRPSKWAFILAVGTTEQRAITLPVQHKVLSPDRRLAQGWQEGRGCPSFPPSTPRAKHLTSEPPTASLPLTDTHPGRGWRAPTALPPQRSWLGRGHGWVPLPAWFICCLLPLAEQWESPQAWF